MLQTSGGLDGATVSAEDGFFTKMMNGSMDVRKIVALIGAFYWIIMTVFVIPSAILASFISVMLPALLISVSWFNWIDHKLCRMVNNHWATAVQITGMSVVEYGDDISQLSEKRVLFLANHLGLADHFVIMSALRNKGSIVEKYMWVIYNIWKMTPLGVMWIIHGNYFVSGGASKRKQVLEEFKSHLRRNYWKNDHRWIIMYPEGSRLYLIKDRNARYAAREGRKIFRHCALPRVGAAHAAIEVAASAASCGGGDTDQLTYIIDCTLGYQKGEVPSFGAWMLGELPSGIPNVYPIKPEWQNEDALKEWLYKIYEEKDNLLDEYYSKGVFPLGPRSRPSVVHSAITSCLLVQAFWLILFYAHYWLWLKPLATAAYCYFCLAT